MSEAPIGSQAAFGEDELDEDEARRDWLRVAARVAPPRIPFFAFSSLLLPVSPLAAWAIITALCDIRDELRGWESGDSDA
jgi:hypothetical protein